MKILLGKSQIAMRKCKGLNSSLTAGYLKKQGALEKLVHLDEGFKFLRALRGFLMSNVSPLGSISDWFYRVEYQQRGSPHIHMLLWIKNAPLFGINDDNEVISFIGSIITCQKPSGNLNLITLVNRQIHRHSHSCRKRKKNECRFNYPQPPMETTQILHPLDKDIEPHLLKHYKEMWTRIKKELNDLKEGQSV